MKASQKPFPTLEETNLKDNSYLNTQTGRIVNDVLFKKIVK